MNFKRIIVLGIFLLGPSFGFADPRACSQKEVTCVPQCTTRWNDGSCMGYGADYCARGASCVPTCKTRWNDGSCMGWAADTCSRDESRVCSNGNGNGSQQNISNNSNSVSVNVNTNSFSPSSSSFADVSSVTADPNSSSTQEQVIDADRKLLNYSDGDISLIWTTDCRQLQRRFPDQSFATFFVATREKPISNQAHIVAFSNPSFCLSEKHDAAVIRALKAKEPSKRIRPLGNFDHGMPLSTSLAKTFCGWFQMDLVGVQSSQSFSNVALMKIGSDGQVTAENAGADTDQVERSEVHAMDVIRCQARPYIEINQLKKIGAILVK